MNLRRTQTFSPYYQLSMHFSHTTTGVYMKVNVSITQLCPTLCDSMDYSPSGSSVHGILQARILEWAAIPFSRGSSQPRDWTCVSCIAGFFTIWATREANLLPYSLNCGGKKSTLPNKANPAPLSWLLFLTQVPLVQHLHSLLFASSLAIKHSQYSLSWKNFDGCPTTSNSSISQLPFAITILRNYFSCNCRLHSPLIHSMSNPSAKYFHHWLSTHQSVQVSLTPSSLPSPSLHLTLSSSCNPFKCPLLRTSVAGWSLLLKILKMTKRIRTILDLDKRRPLVS